MTHPNICWLTTFKDQHDIKHENINVSNCPWCELRKTTAKLQNANSALNATGHEANLLVSFIEGQTDNEELWEVAETDFEALLQHELRRLHGEVRSMVKKVRSELR